eukprot:jgi/Tetstr1/429196/TSEL_019149.t1
MGRACSEDNTGIVPTAVQAVVASFATATAETARMADAIFATQMTLALLCCLLDERSLSLKTPRAAQAVAILSTARIMCEGGDLSGDMGPKEFVQKLKALAQTDDMAERLDSILQGLEKFELEGPSTSLCKSVRASISEAIQIRADDAVACSLWAMCTNWEQPREAVIRAACFGGDSARLHP